MAGKLLSLDLAALNQYIEVQCGGKEYYFGCWSPEDINIEHSAVTNGLQIEKGKNWFALRNGVDQVEGILFPNKANDKHAPELVSFRGYLGEAEINSYSGEDRVRDYWSANLDKRHSGIFSAAIINEGAKNLSLVTDIFGIGPLFYRCIGNCVLFSSTPALLSFRNDKKDIMSWALRKKLGYVPGDTTLSEEIKKPPPASVMTFSENKTDITKWYNYDDFALGGKPVDDQALEACEVGFAKAVERCCKSEFGKVKLPLSSGFDSRRIFAHLKNGNEDLETFTVQMPTGRGEDVDGIYAPMMSKDFGYSNKIFKIPTAEQWHQYDIQRLFSLAGETDFHTWSVRVFDYYRGQNISIYDGLGGDVMGFYGWNFIYNPDQIIPDDYSGFINKSAFPAIEKLKLKMKQLHNEQPKGINQDLISFCVWQSRCGTSIWAQQQALPGQLILCPYFDLEYIETMLSYSTPKGEKYVLQNEVLKKYWPKISAYKGSGNLPDNPKNLKHHNNRNKITSKKELVSKLREYKYFEDDIKKLLTPTGRILLFFSQYSNFLANKIGWWAGHIVEMVYWWHSRPFIIEFIGEDDIEEKSSE